MNYVKNAIFALSLVLAVPAINAMQAPKDKSKVETAKEYAAKAKSYAKTQYAAHPRLVKGGACAAITAAVTGGLYKYNQKFKNMVNTGIANTKTVANDYVVAPVSNLSSKTKKIVGATVGAAVVGVASYFGYNKYYAPKAGTKPANPKP